jgi:hypothetical protein
MPAAKWVGQHEFRDALRSMVDGTRELAIAVEAVRQRRGPLPAVDSPAMREIADEARYKERSGLDAPFTLTHTLSGLTLTAVNDYVRTFAEAFTTEHTPVYGHLVLARAALEAATVSRWLTEAGISRDNRLQRGLSEFIYAANEEWKLKLLPNGRTNVKAWIEHATKLGWAVTDGQGAPWVRDSQGKPQVEGVGRPAPAAAIRDLLVDDQTSKIGKLQWSRLSAVAHVTFFGTRGALSLDQGVRNPVTGLVTVPLGTDAIAVYLQAVCITKALRQTAASLFELMGWVDREWSAAARGAERHERGMLAAIEASRPQALDEELQEDSSESDD